MVYPIFIMCEINGCCGKRKTISISHLKFFILITKNAFHFGGTPSNCITIKLQATWKGPPVRAILYSRAGRALHREDNLKKKTFFNKYLHVTLQQVMVVIVNIRFVVLYKTDTPLNSISFLKRSIFVNAYAKNVRYISKSVV